MNVSALAKNTKTKVTSVLNLNSDIIFLSDVRLGNKAKHVSDLFRLRYRFFHHSTQARRGVAVLIRNELSFILDRIIKDDDENCILLDGTISGQKVAIGSIYGPNDDNRTFFEFLDSALLGFKNQAIIIGGDWNTTVSPLPAEINPDVVNMRTILSQVRTTWLNNVMDKHDLIDPFRYLNPNMMDFSYSPYGTVRKNRSRIDFFLTSGNLSNSIKKCEIASGLCKKNFDHKSIFLQLGTAKKNGRKSVNNRITGNPLFRLIVILATYETYIGQIACAKNGVVDAILTNLCSELDTITPHLVTLISFCDSWSWRPLSHEDKNSRDATLGIIENILGNAVTIDELAALPKKLMTTNFLKF